VIGAAMRKRNLRTRLIAAFVIALLFGLTSASTSLLFAATSCEDDPHTVFNTITVKASTAHGPVRWSIPMWALQYPGPINLGASVQIELWGHWTAIQNPDRSVDAYDAQRDCILHFGCNYTGCPSIDSTTAADAHHELTITMPTPR
jgi:hypothetical protein